MKSYDVKIDGEPYLFGPEGGIALGNALKEPTQPGSIASVDILSLHHGAGQLIALDPMAYQGVPSGVDAGADASLPGFILPGGKLDLISTIVSYGNHAFSSGGSYLWDDDELVMVAGNKLIKITISTDTVLVVQTELGVEGYTGSIVRWKNELLLGVEGGSGSASRVRTYPGLVSITATHLIHSWAVSTRTALFWVKNFGPAVGPEMRWTDRTDIAYASLAVSDVFGPFTLDPVDRATGMVAVGPYALVAARNGMLFGFDPIEVFVPVSPPRQTSKDYFFGGPMQQILSQVLVPHEGGIFLYDPRTLELTDLTPPTFPEQPGPSAVEQWRVSGVTSVGSGAVMAAFLGGTSPIFTRLHAYAEGLYYHPLRPRQTNLTKVHATALVRDPSTGKFKLYIAGREGLDLKIYRLHVASESWQPGPHRVADTSGLLTSKYMGNPPFVSKTPIQVRGYGRLPTGAGHIINLKLLVDGTTYDLGNLPDSEGPFALKAPSTVVPGRAFQIQPTITVDNVPTPADNLPYLALPLSVDYAYSQESAAAGIDRLTITVTVSSETINKAGGRWFGSARAQAEALVKLQGKVKTVEFADSETVWSVLVEEATASQVTPDAGDVASPEYQVKLVCRRL